jgi:hypothetical protein
MLSVILFDEKSVERLGRFLPERRVLLVIWNVSLQRFHRDTFAINNIELNNTIRHNPNKGILHVLAVTQVNRLQIGPIRRLMLHPETRPLKTTEANDFDGSHAQSLEHPCVLSVPILVFEYTEGVGDALESTMGQARS